MMAVRNRIGAGRKELGADSVDLEDRRSLDWSYDFVNVEYWFVSSSE
jgi:hypothetical protein